MKNTIKHTMKRNSAATLGLAAKYLALASLLSASIIRSESQPVVISDFSSANWNLTSDQGIASYRVEDGQLVITGDLPPGTSLLNTFTLISWDRALSLQDSETLEIRVDLVDADEEDVQTLIQWKHWDLGGYALARDRDEIWLTKFRQVSDGANAPFFYEELPIKSERVTLSMAITLVDPDVVIRVAVLDKDANDAVLFQRTVTDTEAIDPTVASFRGHTFYPDPGPPWRNANAIDLAVLSMSSERQADFRLVLDNFTYSRSSEPAIGVERAVRLSWPARPGSWVVEGAKQLEGPWVEVQEPSTTIPGIQQVTVPAQLAEEMKVFRLRQIE
jgi:hypothetical protein